VPSVQVVPAQHSLLLEQLLPAGSQASHVPWLQILEQHSLASEQLDESGLQARQVSL
jgi:hypothetical protein